MDNDQRTTAGAPGAKPTAGGPDRGPRRLTKRLTAIAAVSALALTAGAAYVSGAQAASSAGGIQQDTAATSAAVPSPEGAPQTDTASPAPQPGDEPLGHSPAGTTTTPQTPTNPSGPSASELRYVADVGGWIVEDIEALDEWMLDGIMVCGRLNMLALNYERLASSAAPPGSDAAQYFALAATLASTTREAAEVYDVDPATGTAKYEVVRSRTAELLDMINTGVGTSHRLPSR